MYLFLAMLLVHPPFFCSIWALCVQVVIMSNMVVIFFILKICANNGIVLFCGFCLILDSASIDEYLPMCVGEFVTPKAM